MTILTLGMRAAFALIGLFFAWLNLREAGNRRREQDYVWARYFMTVSNIWIAAVIVIAAVTVGGLQ